MRRFRRYKPAMTMMRYSARPDGLRLAYSFRPGNGPIIVFLPGYMSDMEGGKALALDAWAEKTGRAMLRLDYSGCGASEGAFSDGTLDIWRDDVLHLLDTLTEGPLVLIGSSMGGWLMLLVALARSERIHAVIGIAAAPDFTDWGFTEAQKADLSEKGRLEEVSEYSDDPYVTTLDFWKSGQDNRLLGNEISITAPVRLLQGQRDMDVPWHHALRLAENLRSDDVHVVLVKDGDHRLSREDDLELLIRTVAQVLDS